VESDSAISICDLVRKNDSKVYLVNGTTLKQCIGDKKDVVLYIWKPACQGKLCYSLNALQEKCKATHKALFVVAEYYDGERMAVHYNIERPIFGIDVNYYNTNLTSKYLPKFLYDLTAQKAVTGSLIYFKDGNFVRSYSSIDSLL
jgi:hypothetical protein